VTTNLIQRAFCCAALSLLVVNAGAQTNERSTIVVGQTYSQTGPLASLSVAPLIGIRAALHANNQRGGVNGQTIKLIQLDDASDPVAAAANVKKFVDAKAVAVLMPIGTTGSTGALKGANELKIPMIGAYSGAPAVAAFTPYGFPTRIKLDEECKRIVNHLLTIGVTRIAFAYNDNPGARAAMEGTRKHLQERGYQLLGSVALKHDSSDASAKAAELAALKPDAVMFSLTIPVSGAFVQAYKTSGASAQFYSFSFLDGRSLFKAIGSAAGGVVVSQVVPYPWNIGMPIIAEYRSAMQAIGETDISYGSLEGFINTKILIEALKRAGSNPSPEAVKRALESFNSLDLGGLAVSYSAREHKGLQFFDMAMITSDGGYLR
jgi:branched-chain amino acid transport system substrate-binding protein